MKIYDVTVPLSEDLVGYPDDPPVRIERTKEIAKDYATYNLSTYSFGSHAGTHIDAPLHLLENGLSVDNLPLEMLIGRARVVEVTAPRIDENVLQEFDFTTDMRVLFKTRNSYLWGRNEFVQDYVHITVDAARFLIKEGIKLVGIDYLSIDKFDSKELESHREFLSAGAIIIEGLNLREVEPGDYELLCLPLKVKGGDGAPARVVLRQN
jgi:arylformamidase